MNLEGYMLICLCVSCFLILWGIALMAPEAMNEEEIDQSDRAW